MRTTTALGLAVVLVALPAACSGRSDVDVLSVRIDDEAMALEVEVDTCNESSTEVSVTESDEAIVVRASTRFGFGCGGRDDCADVVSVELDAPVGDRRIVNDSGDEVRPAPG